MPKPSLTEPNRTLERQVISTLIPGLQQWRPDLNHPESHSDTQACVRGLLRMFELKLRPLAIELGIDDS